MAITIGLQPQLLEPTYNPIIVVATSSNQNLDGFLMVGDLFVNGVNVTRLRVAADPSGYFLFDLHKHIENRTGYDFHPLLPEVNPATYSQATYSLRLGEEWRPSWSFVDNIFLPGGFVGFIGAAGDNPQPQFSSGATIVVNQIAPFTFSQYNGATTITTIIASSSVPGYPGNRWIIQIPKGYLGSTPANGGTISLAGYQTFVNVNVANIGETSSLSGQKWAMNGVRTFLEDISWDFQQYRAGTYSGGTASWLTNVPENYGLGTASRMWLHAFATGTNDIKRVYIQSDQGIFYYTNTFASPTYYNKQPLIQAAVGPNQLLTYTSGLTVVSGALPVIASTTKSYKVWCQNASGVITIQPKTFSIKPLCSRYEKIQLLFVDKLGSIIPFIFNMVNRETRNINRTAYAQHYGQYAPSSQSWQYNTWDRGKKTLDTQITQNWTINSDWVSQSESDFLMTLFESPDVWWLQPDGTALAISITSQSVERKQTINDLVINYVLTFELSQKNNSQKG